MARAHKYAFAWSLASRQRTGLISRMNTMDGTDLRPHPFAMPATSPAYPPGPYRFANREYSIILSRTDPLALRRVFREPTSITEPVVTHGVIRMPDSAGSCDITTRGQGL